MDKPAKTWEADQLSNTLRAFQASTIWLGRQQRSPSRGVGMPVGPRGFQQLAGVLTVKGKEVISLIVDFGVELTCCIDWCASSGPIALLQPQASRLESSVGSWAAIVTRDGIKGRARAGSSTLALAHKQLRTVQMDATSAPFLTLHQVLS